MANYYGHTSENNRVESWQLLMDHLLQTARFAEEFAAVFDAGRPARVAALVHDLGKFSAEFQAYIGNPDFICPNPSSPDHSTAGAQLLHELIPGFGLLIAYVIAGHHAGLPDYLTGNAASLSVRLKKKICQWRKPESEKLLSELKLSLKDFPPPLLAFLKESCSAPQEYSFALSFFTRMLYSCIVDADFLDTESFLKPEQFAARQRFPDEILLQMEQALTLHLEQFQQKNEVDRIRAGILKECLEAAEKNNSLFSLTVPTGGGKTLSSLAFALKHAIKYQKKRIVYVLPFVTITEQTADVFRNVFSGITPDPVLEVHSNLIQEDHLNADEEGKTLVYNYQRLASENFDAPLVVTTTVQFYESLMGNRSSRCRKIHNLANSVIILDEAQKIPVKYMTVIMNLFKQLTRIYRSTLVLCTATQPAINYDKKIFRIGLPAENVCEIISDPHTLVQNLKRNSIQQLGRQSDSELLKRFERERQMLCVVNTRAHAAKLFHGLKRREGDYHLSTNMCAAHRRKFLEEIRARMASDAPCRVISTQLIEAGVDLDFAFVYRALAGCDSIVQAAGRCNRNGKRPPEQSIVYVFESEHIDKEAFQALETATAREMIRVFDDIASLDAMERYFMNYYYQQKLEWDHDDIMGEFSQSGNEFNFNFATASKKFHLIDDSSVPVLIPYGEGRALLEELRDRHFPDFKMIRALQPYAVQMRQREYHAQLGERKIELLWESVPILISPEQNYDEWTGLSFDSNDFSAFQL